MPNYQSLLTRDLSEYASIPEETMRALCAYVEDRQPPGAFLMAVLSSDLYMVGVYADTTCLEDKNMKVLHLIVKFLSNQCPFACWGTVDKVHNWINSVTW